MQNIRFFLIYWAHKYIYLSPIGVQWKVLVFSNLLGVKTPIQCEQKPNCFLCLGGGDPQYSTFWVKLASWLTSLIASILIITNMCIHLLPSLELKNVWMFLSWTDHAPNGYYDSWWFFGAIVCEEIFVSSPQSS